jgi:hypothetical protein
VTLRRRDLLGSAAFGAALMGGVPGRLPAGEPVPSLDSLEAHVRMRCNLHGQRSYWFYTGTVFGNVVGESTRPMLGVEGVSFSVLEELPGGRYRYSLTEAGYYLDVETQAMQDEVVNPFTGASYRPKHYLSSQTNIFAPDLSVTPELEFRPPGLEYRGVITPLRTFKNAAWSAEDLFVRIPNPRAADDPDQPTHRVQTSLATLTANLDQLLDPDLDFVDCQLNYQTLGTWRDWMGMGATPGMISWRMVGTKCSESDLPAYLVERIAADHDGFFDG